MNLQRVHGLFAETLRGQVVGLVPRKQQRDLGVLTPPPGELPCGRIRNGHTPPACDQHLWGDGGGQGEGEPGWWQGPRDLVPPPGWPRPTGSGGPPIAGGPGPGKPVPPPRAPKAGPRPGPVYGGPAVPMPVTPKPQGPGRRPGRKGPITPGGGGARPGAGVLIPSTFPGVMSPPPGVPVS